MISTHSLQQRYQQLKRWSRDWVPNYPLWLHRKTVLLGLGIFMAAFILVSALTHKPSTPPLPTTVSQIPTSPMMSQNEVITALMTLVERHTQVIHLLETLVSHWQPPHPSEQALLEIAHTGRAQQEQLTQALRSLTDTIAPLSAQTSPTVASLPLPFEVIALEYWNEQPFVRITDPHRPMEQLITLYEYQGDWQLTHIDPKQRWVRFQSIHQETAEVILP